MRKNLTEFCKQPITDALRESFWYLMSYALLMKKFFDRKWDIIHDKIIEK